MAVSLKNQIKCRDIVGDIATYSKRKFSPGCPFWRFGRCSLERGG